MSVHVSSWVWKHSKAKGTQLLVLLSLADMANDDGACWPSIRMICERCRVSERAVQENLRAAESIGELEIRKQQGKYGTNVFQFTAFRGAPNAPLASRGEPERISGVRHPAPKTSLEPSKETTTKSASRSSPNGTHVVVDFSLASSGDSDEEIFDKHVQEFGPFNAIQRQEIEGWLKHDRDYVLRQAEIVRSKPRNSAAAAYLSALRDDWQPRKKIEKVVKQKKVKEPKDGAPAEPLADPQAVLVGLLGLKESIR
jgi:hypothetical protein